MPFLPTVEWAPVVTKVDREHQPYLAYIRYGSESIYHLTGEFSSVRLAVATAKGAATVANQTQTQPDSLVTTNARRGVTIQ